MKTQKAGKMGNPGNSVENVININEIDKNRAVGNLGKQGNLIDFSHDWEEPVFFDDFKLTDIPASILPSPYKDLAVVLSERLETPESATVLCMLSILATALQNKYVVQVENDYAEPLNLYLMAAMPPANRKTAILKTCSKPVLEYEKKQRLLLEEEHRRQLSVYHSQRRLIENERKRLTEEKAKNGAIEEIAAKEASLIEPSALPKLFLTDATTESLATALYEQNGKISIITDEGGFLDSCSGLYTGGQTNIDVLLKGWDGGSLSIKRRDREVYITPLITIFMIVQPVIFENMAKNKNFTGKGFFERFLFCEPKSKIGFRNHKGKPVPAGLTKEYEERIKAFLEMPTPRSPIKLSLNKAALNAWRKFQDKIERDLRKGGKLELCQGWGGKLCGQTLRIAGLLHLARYEKTSATINEDTMKDAISLAESLVCHAAKVFDNFILSSDVRIKEASVVWNMIKGFNKKSVIQREIVYALRHKMVAEHIKELLKVLIERNLISEPIRAPGGRTTTYLVNPKALRKTDV